MYSMIWKATCVPVQREVCVKEESRNCGDECNEICNCLYVIVSVQMR